MIDMIVAVSIDVYLLSSYRGWIMEAIPKESAEAIGQTIRVRYLPVRLRDSLNLRNIFSRVVLVKPSLRLYMNHVTYLRHKTFRSSSIRVFVTHFDESEKITPGDVRKLLKVDKFFVQNLAMKSELKRFGVDEERIEVVFGAISAREYYPVNEFSEIVSNQVLIVGDCKPRKNPHLVEATIRENQDFNFVIHGKNWDKFTTISQSTPPNVELLEFNSANNPRLMRQSVALLTLANNEGGPFPILESLASGTPVVATATGFAPDLIDKNKGVLLELDPSSRDITAALKFCRDLKMSIWNQDLTSGKLTWKELGSRLYK